jgi:hypothetical protein
MYLPVEAWDCLLRLRGREPDDYRRGDADKPEPER